jgi:hypothetical protein
MTDRPQDAGASTPATNNDDRPPLTEAARRALAEADARRVAAKAAATQATEIGGRGGLDPARYGDWEVKGVASDF